MISQVANLFQYYQKWVFEEKNFLRTLQEKPINLSLDGFAGSRFCREIGFAGRPVSQGDWFRRETGVGGKPVSCYPC